MMSEGVAKPDFYALRDQVRARFGGRGGEAATVAPDRLPERWVQAIWFERMFHSRGLKTVSGKPLEVISAGRWNEGPGPDFLAAEIAINGKTLKGDIEVHVEAGDWDRHGHGGDYRYNGLVLHVCLDNAPERASDELHNGRRVERFALRPVLYPDLETIRQTLQPEDYPYDSEAGFGLCHEYCLHEEEELLRGFLAAGGRERMEGKIRRLSGQLEGADFSQLVYQALMTAMGIRGNKALFFLLSKRAPIGELLDYTDEFSGQERVERMEAVLLHVSGLAPRSDASPESLPPDTLEYLNRINRHWSELAGYFGDRLIPPTRRWHANVRPVNFPYRRLAGVALFAARTARRRDLFSPLVDHLRVLIPSDGGARAIARFTRGVAEMLTVDAPEDFWATHYTFQAEAAPRPMSLIGASRAKSMAFNSLIPLLVLYARKEGDRALEKFAWRWFERFPLLEANSVTRFMRHRLFGADPRGKALIDGEAMQQGLFQIFHSCCNNRERDCAECYFLRRQS